MTTHSYLCVVLEYLETVPPKPLVVSRAISPTCESLFVMGLDVLRNGVQHITMSKPKTEKEKYVTHNYLQEH